jgi:hypothetical protein
MINIDIFNLTQDRLLGLNVRHYHYLTQEENLPGLKSLNGWSRPLRGCTCSECQGYEEWTTAPYAVTVYDDGLDYDADGNSYPDDAPGHHPHSYHHTRRSAEIEAAWLQHHGTEAWRITIAEDIHVAPWERQDLNRWLAKDAQAN